MRVFAALVLATSTSVFAQQFITGQAARVVIGQATFTRQLPGPTERLLGSVSGLALVNNTLFVVDSSRLAASPQDNRVLIFSNLAQQMPAPKDSIPWNGDVRCPVCIGQADVVLGQSDFTTSDIGLGANKFRTPTAVASDGQVLAVADTDNNRVLLWLSIPTATGQSADVVVGQANFNGNVVNFGGSGATPSAKGLRGPQGVWIQDGKLYIADTQNDRVLIFNSIPRQNGASADVVLGQPNFTTFVQSDLVQATLKATVTNMLNPVSVTSDGKKLFVSDLGHNRVMIWNSIPTQSQAPVDVVVGQPDVNSNDTNKAYLANNSSQLCASNGTDSTTGNATYPDLCGATLNFPRFALSDGTRLFIADGGNDRILVYNSIPNANGQAADVILGQLTDQLNSDSDPNNISSSDTIRTPSSLAWDGTNLYVSDPFNRRILAFTPGDQLLPITGVRNAASRDIFAVGAVTFTADPKENDQVTLKIADDKEYTYKAVANDTIAEVINGLLAAINNAGGDPHVLVTANIGFNSLVMTSRVSGDAGNSITWTVTLSDGAQLAVSATSGTLGGGQNAAQIAPGTLVTILGDNLADSTASAPANAVDLPQTLANVEVYFDGIRAPLLYVSPTQINSQMPWEVNDSSSVSCYVRKIGKDGRVIITNAIGVPIIPQNPGIFAAEEGTDPRPARAVHGSSFATGVVSVDGSITANDTATVNIEDRAYTYTVTADDTLVSVRDKLIDLINQDEKVTASAASVFTRILLQSRVPGPDGEGITYSGTVSTNATIIITPLSPSLCCASTEDAPVTDDNPARPGEIIKIFATGLGIVQPDEAKFNQVTGTIFRGPDDNQPNSPVDDAQAGGKTANVIAARLLPGFVGLYELKLQLNSDIPTNPETQLYIAQIGYISNIVKFPVVNPNPPAQ